MSSRINNAYTATLNDPSEYPKLAEHLDTDIAIVGGGLTGVATAVELAEKGFRVALVEAHRIGWGASGRNGGQVTGSLSGDDAMLKQLQQREGVDAAEFVWHMRWHGHQIIQRRVARYDIECDLQHGHLHTAWSKKHVAPLQQATELAHQHGMQDDVEFLDRDAVHALLDTPLYHGAVRNQRCMHLHSLNLCMGEARAAASLGAAIFENSAVSRIERQAGQRPTVHTDHGQITADAVILAGNAYHHLEKKALRGLLFPAILGNMATAPLSNELIAQLNPANLAVYDSRFVLDYYRLTGDNRLMFGGGTNYSGRDIGNVAAALRPAMERTFPALQGVAIDFAWTGTAGIVLNRIPMLGRLDGNVYYAQGYSGHGIATSHLLADMLADALSGTLQRFDLFSSFDHPRVPLGSLVGSPMLAMGMLYYRLKERLAG